MTGEQSEGPAELRLLDLLQRLTDAGVDFVVVGGIAVVLQASPRFTADLDICPAPATENLERLAAVLLGLGAELRGIHDDVPFVPDARTLAQVSALTLVTTSGNLDLLLHPEGVADYHALRRRADRMELDGLVIHVASIEDLIAMKTAAGRPQDVTDVEALEIARLRRGVRPATRER
jgi:hypothetical protein